MLVLGPGAPAWAKKTRIIQTLETRTGEIVFLKLPGNPSVGYKWRLNKDLSKGLDLVKVDEIGWFMAQKGRSMFFQEQSMLNVAVRALSAGQADLAFDYYRRMGGRTYTRTSIVRVVIKPPPATQ
ncbi:chagasin family peptidase inhibitor I42 [bacterium BMS3Bbin10]|nr:chagasin family peptidase inhibitor I42 [bacterium BMS3Bbin10]